MSLQIIAVGLESVGRYVWDEDVDQWFTIVAGVQTGEAICWTLRNAESRAAEAFEWTGAIYEGQVYAAPIVIDGLHRSPIASLATIKRFAEAHGNVARIVGAQVEIDMEFVCDGRVSVEVVTADNMVAARTHLGY